jgi:hypothetical protein
MGGSNAGATSAPPPSVAGGSSGSDTGGSTGMTPGGAGVPNDPGCASVTRRRVRRLTQEEYELAVTELFGAPPDLIAWSAPDVLVHGFDTNADALSISSGNLDDFALSAELLAGAADVASLAPCPDGTPPEACATTFAASFAERAYGRPLVRDEVERFVRVYRTGAVPDGYEAGIRLAIEAVLMSPNFLYRAELGDASVGSNGELSMSPLEVANALAFAITGTRPDAELRDRATNDAAFLSEGVLREEAARLAAEPSARLHLARFLRGWLGIRDLRAINKIPILFPEFTPGLKADLDHELGLFLGHVLGEGGGTLSSLFGASMTFANARVLGSVYAFDYAAAPEVPADGSFAPISLDPARRRGVLSLGGWLSAHSPVHRSSPVDRGLAIRSRLFCQTLPPPPPDAITSAPDRSDGVTTTRQKFEMHTASPACSGCHVMIDPIGFGFEMMDGMGRFRDNEAGLPVDSSGMLTDTDVDGPFRGPAELADKLVRSRQVRDCFVTQIFRYVEGREERAEDDCELSRLKQAFARGDGGIVELLLHMVLRGSFGRRSLEP